MDLAYHGAYTTFAIDSARNAENLARLEASWTQFLSFEAAGEGHIDRIVPGEAYLGPTTRPVCPTR